ncbi:MAG TPA: hypothetical protein VKW76_03295 [Candidatus Binatia bacterium]|nr:hypothetical protein [Candidatus Binatia bacterium]
MVRRAGMVGLPASRALLAPILVLLSASAARGYGIALRWRPSPSTGVAGYNVWVRPATGKYTTPIDAKLPKPAADGTLSFTVSNLDATVSYACSVTAYTATRQPSPRSNELIVPAQAPPVACKTNADCNDKNACTTDACVSGACQHTVVADGTSCSDGNACNGLETCHAGKCTAGPALVCDDHDPCTLDGCTAAKGCTHTPVLGCTACATAAACDDADPCTTDACSPAGTCTHTPRPGCVRCRTDADCADGNRCTVSRCAAGVCTHPGVACPAPAPCMVTTCDPRAGCGTAPAADGTACPSGDPCTAGLCAAGRCVAVGGGGTALLLDVHRLVVGGVGRLLARGAFPAMPPLDPAASGVGIELRADDGQLVYAAELPAAAFRSQGAHTVHYVAGIPPPADGLRRLVFVRRADRVAVELRAGLTPTDAAAAAGHRLTWLLRFGAACVRREGLACTPASARGVRCG